MVTREDVIHCQTTKDMKMVKTTLLDIPAINTGSVEHGNGVA